MPGTGRLANSRLPFWTQLDGEQKRMAKLHPEHGEWPNNKAATSNGHWTISLFDNLSARAGRTMGMPPLAHGPSQGFIK